MVISFLSGILQVKPNSTLITLFQGLSLLELGSHLKRKTAQLHQEGLGCIKLALAGTDTSSPLEILKGAFGHMDLDTSTSSISTDIPAQESIITKKPSEKPPEKVPVVPSEESSLASAKLVFPLKSIPLVTACLPKSVLPFCSPETLSHYRCQHPSCDQEFSQKVMACNHVHCDHLNLALACLYCSFSNTLRMHWYSASVWKHHTCKHVQDNLPMHPKFSNILPRIWQG